MYFGFQINQYLRVLVGRTFKPISLVVFLSIYPIFIGIFLALPNFISKAEDKEVGQLTAIGHYAPPQFVLWLNQFNQAVTISGVVFG